MIIQATAACTGRTGVEMEALTAASACALTIYDMLKGTSHDIVISNIELLTKPVAAVAILIAKPHSKGFTRQISSNKMKFR